MRTWVLTLGVVLCLLFAGNSAKNTKGSVAKEVNSMLNGNKNSTAETQSKWDAIIQLIIQRLLDLEDTSKKHEVRLTIAERDIDDVNATVTTSANYDVPMGAIIPWVPRPDPLNGNLETLPSNFQYCDGSQITKGPWIGLYTPDLRGMFIRGASKGLNNLSTYLKREEDMIRDHKHIDGGHTHTDAGHTHTYVDQFFVDYGNGNDNGMDNSDYEKPTKTTGTGYANIQSSNANVLFVDPATTGATQIGEETRPKNVNVIYVMRIM